MKVILNNSSLLFRTFVMDEDFVIDGTMTPTNHNGTYKLIPLSGGKMYLLSLPKRSEYSLENYTSSYTNLIKLGEKDVYHTVELPNDIYMLEYLILEPAADVDLYVFARTDVGSTLTYHIKEIEPSHNWILDGVKTINVTQGSIASILSGNLKMNTAYKFIADDPTIVDVNGIRFATTSPSWTEINGDEFVITHNGQFDVDDQGAVGTGTVNISIMTLNLNDIIG